MHSRRPRRSVPRAARLPLLAAAAVVLGLVLLRPVLLGPVTGDDVAAPMVPAADPGFSVVTALADLPREWEWRVERGRVNVLTAVERRVAGHAMVETAVATGRPVHHVQALQKLGYAGLSFLAVYLLIRNLRWRRRDDGRLVGVSPPVRRLAMTTIWLAFAVGGQPQLVGLHGWNGWLAYPVSTWTAAFSIFAPTALLLWLSRLTAEHGWRVGAPAALLAAGVGVVSNYRYELTFPAFPLALTALALVPVTARTAGSRGLRAKAGMGAAYGLGFVPLLLVNRRLLADVCAASDCYGGVTPALGTGVVRTLAVNVTSSIPGIDRDHIRALLREESVPSEGAWTPTLWSVAVALALLTVLAAAWRSGRPPTRRDEAAARAEGAACLVGALLLGLGALGAALVMSLSADAQSGLAEVGILFRHSVVTWLGLAGLVVMLVLGLGLLRPRRAAGAFAALVTAMALLTLVKVPADERVMAANAARMAVTTRIYHEVVRGEDGAAANARRCRLHERVAQDFSRFHAESARRASSRVFRHYWGGPFCSRR